MPVALFWTNYLPAAPQGAFIGPGNAQGEAVEAGGAWGQVFGLVLLNDWSARQVRAAGGKRMMQVHVAA